MPIPAADETIPNAPTGSGSSPAPPGPADEATAGTALPDSSEPAAAPPQSLWTEWLAAFDRNENRVDDEAESVAQAAVDAGRPDERIPVLITYQAPPGPAEARILIDDVSARDDLFIFHRIPTINALVPAASVPLLGGLPGVEGVEYDYPVEPVLQVSGPSIQAIEGAGANTFYNGLTAESLGYRGEGMVVAVLDTGVNDLHGAFAGKWVAGADTSTFVTIGCVNPADDQGHGTHVGSTAVGNGGGVKGIAFQSKLVEIRIAAGGASIGGIERGYQWVLDYNEAIRNGSPLCGVSAADRIDVATLSFGSTGRGGPSAGPTTENLVRDLLADGVVVTIAAGNCGPQASSTCSFSDDDNGIASPANAAGAIAVASFFDSNTVNRNNDVISGFSSRGPVNGNGDAAAGGATSAANLKDRYRKPEIALPGEGIQAAGPAPFLLSTQSGTSMATPHMAGVAALLLQAGEQAKAQTGGVNLMAPRGLPYDGSNTYVPGLNPALDAVLRTADYKETGAKALWTGANSAGVQWNNAWGYGQANTFAALCWAWANILVPGGAVAPSVVQSKCDLGPLVLTAEAGGPYSGLVGTAIGIAGSAVGGTPAYSFAWTVVSGPAGDVGSFDNAVAASTTFTPGVVGTYVLRLSVTDAVGGTSSDTAALVSTSAPPTASEVHILDPSDGQNVEPGPLSVSGSVVRVGGGGGGARTLFFVGDGTSHTATLTDASQSRYAMSPLGNGGMQTTLRTTLAPNLAVADNALAATYFHASEVILTGGTVRVYAYVDYNPPQNAVAPICTMGSQLYGGSAAGATPLGPAGGVQAPVPLGLGVPKQVVFEINPTPGTYPGLMAQMGPFFADCGTPADWFWGVANFNGRVELAPGDVIVGFGGAAPERVDVFLDAEPSPRATVDVATIPPAGSSDAWSVGLDLTGFSGAHAITAKWFEGPALVDADAVTVNVVRVNHPPTAAIQGPMELDTGKTGAFSGASSSDPDGSIVSYEWDMGDGTHLSGVDVTHAWSAPGDYAVTLTVTDNEGAAAFATHGVAVRDPRASEPTVRILDPVDGTVFGPDPSAIDLSGDVDRGLGWVDGPPPTTTTALASYDFETGGACSAMGWTSYNLLGGSLSDPDFSVTFWELYSERADTAPCAWYHGIPETGTYPDLQETLLESPSGSGCFALPAGSLSAQFDYRIAGRSEETFDFLRIQAAACNTADTAAWSTLQALSGRHGDWTTNPPTYVTRSADLTSLIGTGAFQLRIGFDSDETAFFEGFRVDTFRLTARTPAPSVERVELRLDGSAAPFDSIGLTTSAASPTALWASSLDLSGAAAGEHAIGARWLDADGATLLDTDLATIQVVVALKPPTAAISGPSSLEEEVEGTFDGSGSTDPDGSIVNWGWNLGDGTFLAGPVVTHSYAEPGTYLVRLRVTDNDGQTDEASQTVTVTQAAPPPPEPGERQIQAKSLDGHACNDGEWRFTITQLRSIDDAPTSIHVVWENGDSVHVPLRRASGAVAHYATTLHLDSSVEKATANIYEAWTGQFNLGHGPC